MRGENAPLAGGYQELVEAIDEERAQVAHSVLVDAGDWFQGTPEGTQSEGRCAVELMNAAGYDFATLGNHDFDAGQAAVATMLDLARFRVFARNLRLEKPRRAVSGHARFHGPRHRLARHAARERPAGDQSPSAACGSRSTA